MKFVEKFQPICSIDDKPVALGLYETYDEAKDAAIITATEQLPTETVKAFTITKVYINEAVTFLDDN